ncbi:MAG: pyridoxal-phosphate dependent enzyme [Thermodesulfobacteriota bacterium]
MKDSRMSLYKCIDTRYDPQTSIVLRYRNAFKSEMTDEEDSKYKEWLERTSIREGVRVFPLLTYKGVKIHILDETSLMHTKTLKSIDGCVTIAKCNVRGYDRVVFESGGNTGTALTEYGQRAGLETFLFLPEENTSLLNSKVFEPDKAHLISVEEPGLVKRAAHLFERLNGLKHIPETGWRYEASRFRGFFILEYMLGNGKFDWLTQTISAAFGPIGIYWVLMNFREEIGNIPRFLGIQQEANCPMYKAWKSKKTILEPIEINSTEKLLTKVMYDIKPHTYGTYKDLTDILVSINGDITTINHPEFADFLEYQFDEKGILELLKDNGIEITVTNGEVLEKTGLIALAGTLKEIDNGKIARGSKVLCCLTSGISEADGKAKPRYRIPSLDSMIKDYSKIVFNL